MTAMINVTITFMLTYQPFLISGTTDRAVSKVRILPVSDQSEI